MRTRGAAERPNAPTCELSEIGEFRWEIINFDNLFLGWGRGEGEEGVQSLYGTYTYAFDLMSLWFPSNSEYSVIYDGVTWVLHQIIEW